MKSNKVNSKGSDPRSLGYRGKGGVGGGGALAPRRTAPLPLSAVGQESYGCVVSSLPQPPMYPGLGTFSEVYFHELGLLCCITLSCNFVAI